MNKKVILWFLLGWGLAIFISPRDMFGFFRPKAA
jgi:hypothetical protein